LWSKAQAQLVCWLTSHCGLWNIGGCVRVVSEMDGDGASSTESSQSDNRCKPENDVLIDFQTGVTIPVLVGYIYNFGTKYVGAQMLASVYILTLVALFGLCFDLTECFQDLCIWYRTVGNMSGNLQYVSWIVTHCESMTRFPGVKIGV